MPDIAIALTADELHRLQQVAASRGLTVEELAAAELRARYALATHVAKVVPIRHKPSAVPGDKQ